MNKSNLMSRAHQIAKNLIGDYAARLSMALKMVWAEIKGALKKVEEITWDIVEKACEKAVDELGMTKYYVNNWIKGEMNRSYIEFKFYAKNGTCKKTIKAGYWDNVKNVYVAEDRRYKQYDVLKKEYV